MHPVSTSQPPVNPLGANASINRVEQRLNLRIQNLASDFLKEVHDYQLEQRFGPELGIPFSPHVFKATTDHAFGRLEHLLLEARDTGKSINAEARQQVKSILEKGLEVQPDSQLGWYLASDFLKNPEHIRVKGVDYSGTRATRVARKLTTDHATHTLLGLFEELDKQAGQGTVESAAPR